MPDLQLPHNLLATPHRFLLHTPSNTAILSDLHLGIEHTMRRQGIAFPDINNKKIREGWSHLLTRLTPNPATTHPQNPGHIIIAGDLFDAPTPDPDSLTFFQELLATLPPHIDLTLIPGNHDPEPTPLRHLLPDSRVTIAHFATFTDETTQFNIIHGHDWRKLPQNPHKPPAETTKPPSKNQKPPPNFCIITGHQHPAVTLRNRLQSAKMICYALCQLPSQNAPPTTLIILPTFSQAPLGTNLINESRWILDCPQPPASTIQILGIVPQKGVLNFGPLSQLPF